LERRATSDELAVASDQQRVVSSAYRAARQRVAFRRRHERGIIRATGKDRLDWLQGLLTNDVKSFDGAGWTYAAWLTPQGRMITDVFVVDIDDETWLDVPAALAPALTEKLDLMIFAEDVIVEHASDRIASVTVCGPEAGTTMASELAADANAFERRGLAIAGDESNRVVIVRTQTRPDEFIVYSSVTRVAGVEESLAHSGAASLDDETAETLRIEAGVPRFLADMTEETIPLEANLENAISHTKGCYVGQEIIVRIRDLAKGRVARKLVGLVPEGNAVPPVGAAIVSAGRSIGRVTSATWSPALGHPIAMAIVHRDYTSPGNVVTVNGVTATVTTLPFGTGQATHST
jgi:folate-binding protein YgfZ